ncbi:Short chain dehydrogenase yanD [Fusarium oxysporum f. sp. albedinis]|nr:Short chain dehydrogenase yanD [Fusarium oxysporum f. sp. albedinis]
MIKERTKHGSKVLSSSREFNGRKVAPNILGKRQNPSMPEGDNHNMKLVSCAGSNRWPTSQASLATVER